MKYYYDSEQYEELLKGRVSYSANNKIVIE